MSKIVLDNGTQLCTIVNNRIEGNFKMSSLSQMPMSSLNTGVYEKIKVMIARREIEPGTRLVQQALAKKLKVSPTPVIEALRRLERDGLVTHIPNLGSFVRQTTVEDVCEIYCLRRALETEACRLFTIRASEDEKRELRALKERMDDAAANGEIARFLETDLKFHMYIVQGAGVDRLREMIENRHIEQRVFQNAPELLSRKTTHLVGMHDGIVAAIGSGDEEAAAAAMRDHLLEAERQYIAVVNQLRDEGEQDLI
jgi:DNA-binding GntR family transcriptional regulator